MAEGGDTLPPSPAEIIDIYSVYRNTLEHSGKHFYELRIKTAHAIVRYSLGAQGRGTFYAVNEAGKRHVEHIVTERLEKKLGAGSKETKEKMEVYMYMNFSPCDYPYGDVVKVPGCCTKLIEFKRDHPGIDLHVRFVGLYNINRQSCWDKNCTHLQDYSVDEAVSYKNEEGLRKLVRAGIDVAVFTEDDWRFVHDILCQGMPPEESPADPKPDVSGEDELLQGLEGLNLGEVRQRCHHRLGPRAEDASMQRDLDTIIKGELKKGEVEGDKGAYEKKK